MKRLSKVEIKWSPQFAYAIGLITTDGNLSIDGRHINFTSKDEGLVVLFKKCLSIGNKIGRKARGGEKEKKYYQVQFGDSNFYEFLVSLGLMPAKSRKLSNLNIPNKYFADFLRGCIDGDGNINIFKHPESVHPQFRIRLSSGSILFLNWIKGEVYKLVKITGGWIRDEGSVFLLTYGKSDATKLLKYIYYSRELPCLIRKKDVANYFLEISGEYMRV